MKGSSATPGKDRGWGGWVGNMGGKYVPMLQICCCVKGHLDQPLNKAALEGDEIQRFTLESLHSAGGRFEGVGDKRGQEQQGRGEKNRT